MWFLFALLSAIFYSALWVLARMSRGIPSAVVASLQHALAPMLLLSVVPTIDYPWHEWWWQLYLVLPVAIMPLTLWALTYAVQSIEVTVVKPLSALSTIVTLCTAVLFFGERVTPPGVLGIVIVTSGLFCLYHGRFGLWKHTGPWIALGSVVMLGINAACVAAVLARFPHPLALVALADSAAFAVNGALAGTARKRTLWTPRAIVILLCFMVIVPVQGLATLHAFSLGPSSYVIAVKRTSVLMTAVIGYVFLREREQSLSRLLLASGLVVIGVILLTL